MKYIKLFESYNQFKPLWDKLLGMSENSVVVERYEEDYDKLMSRGEIFDNRNSEDPNYYQVDLIKGEPSKCHRNCAKFMDSLTSDDNGYYNLVTGWALLDNKWNQHTWIYSIEDGVVIETTLKRDVYYGYILNDKELEEFIFDNI